MKSFIFLMLIYLSLSECELPRNNSERLDWMNQLVIKTQSILNRFNIPSWISQGTLLGSVRDNKTLPWTGDMDLHAFARDVVNLWNFKSSLSQSFYEEKLRVYDYQKNFLRVCFAKKQNETPNFLEKHISPEAKLELYGCVKRSDGLYTIPHNICVWNFSGLFPLKNYHLGNGLYALGPNKAEYWLEQYYGKGWRIPNVYSGNKDLDDICVGKL